MVVDEVDCVTPSMDPLVINVRQYGMSSKEEEQIGFFIGILKQKKIIYPNATHEKVFTKILYFVPF